jgi:hypothetical protein
VGRPSEEAGLLCLGRRIWQVGRAVIWIRECPMRKRLVVSALHGLSTNCGSRRCAQLPSPVRPAKKFGGKANQAKIGVALLRLRGILRRIPRKNPQAHVFSAQVQPIDVSLGTSGSLRRTGKQFEPGGALTNRGRGKRSGRRYPGAQGKTIDRRNAGKRNEGRLSLCLSTGTVSRRSDKSATRWSHAQ